jgi:hypothetical protein
MHFRAAETIRGSVTIVAIENATMVCDEGIGKLPKIWPTTLPSPS